MSTTAASKTKKPPLPNNDPPQPSSSFASLPNDIVINILSRVPRRYHPILPRVSKSLRSLVSSSELRKTRSLMGKDDAFYVWFRNDSSLTTHWFTLSHKTTTGKYSLTSVPFPSPPESYSSALMVGSDIYLLCGYINPSKSMWILDSRSGKLRQGPSMRVAWPFSVAVGQVDEKLYMFGRRQDEEHKEEIQVEVFDTKTQTWEVAPNPDVHISYIQISGVVSPTLDRKIYAKTDYGQVIVYDPRDGKCEKIGTPYNISCSKDVCVIDNVLYLYCFYFGLVWYDSKKKQWRTVKGLELNEFSYHNVDAMAEYNGKLVLIRKSSTIQKMDQICCAMVALEWSLNGLDIVGKVEWSDHILSVPRDYNIVHCLGRTD
ncbi:hypothetical protein EUTSA_v10000440mg [Eutrema salsugineum]|uniref:F-box domain-containing protein n=1 Tax=Eutrema salsugineum TaxID=72664 RepID=V4NIQ1_EUTSA|nr:putative F-box/kelch-repeat protein At4g02310 [Eutrema salsugineum]ESQ46131.1 hypothetical protein EUTSA_v10000440mg [Eutrema salsugineum]